MLAPQRPAIEPNALDIDYTKRAEFEDSGETATRIASSRLRGPSVSGSEAARCEPTMTTGLSLPMVRSRK